MDQTLSDNRQLDELFSQMIANRMSNSNANNDENSTDEGVNPPRPGGTDFFGGNMGNDSYIAGTGLENAKVYSPEEYSNELDCSWFGKNGLSIFVLEICEYIALLSLHFISKYQKLHLKVFSGVLVIVLFAWCRFSVRHSFHRSNKQQ
jgi:hypothetical protein